MRKSEQYRVAGLLGVGFDSAEGAIRITEAENYKIIMGSNECHGALQEMCSRIDEHIKSSGRVISDYTPEEFMAMMQEIY